jgi:hypothetical protein
MKKIVLWLFVIFLGTTFGAGLYESRVVVSQWTTAADGTPRWDANAARSDDTGRKLCLRHNRSADDPDPRQPRHGLAGIG